MITGAAPQPNVGGACSRRSGVEADDGKMPLGLSQNEMVRALLARDAVIRIKSTGAKVGCKQLRRWIEAGRLIFFRSRVDASPQVCDLSSGPMAKSLLHLVASSRRARAAATRLSPWTCSPSRPKRCFDKDIKKQEKKGYVQQL